MKLKTIYSTLIFTILFGQQLLAQEKYNLFNPTPKNKMRPLNTERSSKSDYVNTVDPGHFQIETSLLSVIRNKDCIGGNCSKTSTTTLGDTTTIRLGLTQNSDFQLMFNPYTYRRTISGGDLDKKDGFGDMILRYKYSFSGNNNEKFGIAATPFIKLPTNNDELGNNDVEGGINIPLAYNLNNGWAIGGMTQFNFLKDQNSPNSYRDSYYMSYANAIYLSKNFTDQLFAFAEFYSYKADLSGAHWQNTADFGVHYYVTKDFKVDIGANIGISDAADDLNYYTGFAYKL